MNPQFRHLRAGDAGVLANVADDVFDDEIDAAHAETFLADANHVLIVAISEGRVIGQVAAILHRHIDTPPDLYIDNLGVAPAHRRQGIATRLLELALRAGRELGCESAWVVTERDNDAASELYDRTGAIHETVSMFSYEPGD